MPERTEYLVHIRFDEKAGVWYIAKSDIPGLRLEAATPDDMIKRITDAALELIELNTQREKAGNRPAMRWKPVFDSSLELQST